MSGVAVDSEQFQRIAKALADPRRFEILEHIAQQAEVGCQRLCGCFPVRQATISHHLKELASAGLVESRRDGQFVYYRTRPTVLDQYMAELRRRMTSDVSSDSTCESNEQGLAPLALGVSDVHDRG
jgi:ArsR family transcriptional regulator, arsenate/arsenite/antimonite-responsive transcriptional repressor